MESPDFPPIYFPATPKNMNQNSPLLTSQQNSNTSVINVWVSPIFVKQEELISRAGSFCGFGQVGAIFAGKWIHWRSKSRDESFSMVIPLNLSNRLTCVGRGKGGFKVDLWHDPKNRMIYF
jgi:hypothetical protein